MTRSAYREAMGSFEQALTALPHLPEQPDTREHAIDLRLALRVALRPLALGSLYAKTAQREQAREELSTAIELYRAMGMTFWLPEVEAALVQMQAP